MSIMFRVWPRILFPISQDSDSGKYILFGPQGVLMLENLKNFDAAIVVKGKEQMGSMFCLLLADKKIFHRGMLD